MDDGQTRKVREHPSVCPRRGRRPHPAGDLKQPVVHGLDNRVELRVLCVFLEPTLQGEWHALAGPKLTRYVDATPESGEGLIC